MYSQVEELKLRIQRLEKQNELFKRHVARESSRTVEKVNGCHEREDELRRVRSRWMDAEAKARTYRKQLKGKKVYFMLRVSTACQSPLTCYPFAVSNSISRF